MIEKNIDNFLWVEKYRPKTIEDCVLEDNMKKVLSKFVTIDKLPNLLLYSVSPGTGKTTVARAICEQRDMDYIIINASESGNIDTLRTTIREFASTVSFDGNRKCVILDEADYLNPQSTQPALRGFIEDFAENCSFILTCNYKQRILPPIQSRCSCIEFIIKDKLGMIAKVTQRCMHILNQENIEYEKNSLFQFVVKYFPDIRRIINELQTYSTSGRIDSGIISSISASINIETLFTILKGKKFKDMRQFVVDEVGSESSNLYTLIYSKMDKYITPVSIPAAILILADYQYKSAFVADVEINTAACLTELMFSDEIEYK
jgi:DNA polymerase III delta prime subunit